MPPGQHRHATPGRAVAPPGWTAADGARYNDTRGSWDRDGSDNLAITRSLCGHIDDTPRQAWEDPEALRPTASEGFQASSKRLHVSGATALTLAARCRQAKAVPSWL